MKNKKLILSLIIGGFFISHQAMVVDGWNDAGDTKVTGDEYWGETDNSSKNGVAEYNLSSIYADNVSKEVKAKETGVSMIREEALKGASLALRYSSWICQTITKDKRSAKFKWTLL